MPTIGPFHNLWWADQSTGTLVVDPPGPTRGGYPGFHSSVILPSLFGTISAWIDHQVQRLRWALRLVRRIESFNPEQRAVLDTVILTLERPQFQIARAAVRETATTLGFNRPEAWKPYSHELKASPGRAENTFRHLRACSLTTERARAQGSTLTNPQLHLTVELAYQGFAAMGR